MCRDVADAEVVLAPVAAASRAPFAPALHGAHEETRSHHVRGADYGGHHDRGSDVARHRGDVPPSGSSPSRRTCGFSGCPISCSICGNADAAKRTARASANSFFMARSTSTKRYTLFKMLRLRRGWSHRAAAAAMGLDIGTIARLDRGDVPPRARVQAVLKETFGLPWRVLLSEAPSLGEIRSLSPSDDPTLTALCLERRRIFGDDLRAASAIVGVPVHAFRLAESGVSVRAWNRRALEAAFGRPFAELAAPAPSSTQIVQAARATRTTTSV